MSRTKRTTHQRRRKSTKARFHAAEEIKLASSIRERNSARKILEYLQETVSGAADPDEAIREQFRRIGRHLRNNAMPVKVKAELSRSLLHMLVVAETRLIHEVRNKESDEAKGRAKTLSDRLSSDSERFAAIAEIRAAVQAGLVALDEIDPPPFAG